MTQEKTIEEKLKLLEKEMVTLSEVLDKTHASLEELEYLKDEMKALKVFLGRKYPEFKKQIPEILKKV